jgi:hypothetical protein
MSLEKKIDGMPRTAGFDNAEAESIGAVNWVGSPLRSNRPF